MKKTVLLLLIIILGISSCKNDKSKTVSNDTEKTEQLFTEFQSLYKELLTFKDKSDFKKYGFAVISPYNEWLQKVQEIEKSPDAKLLMKKGVLMGELEQLGLAYVNSKGKETEITKNFN